VQAHEPVRAEARCPEPKNFQIRPLTENATASAAIHGQQKQKARQILADLSGYLASARPATLMVRQALQEFSSYNGKKLIIFRTVLQ
jgi:hypothetical protein